MVQHIRLSQFVITYGPGAILETRNGPRVILMPNIGLFGSGSSLDPSRFEITDQRMTEGLLRHIVGTAVRIFRVPSNAELRIPEHKYVYRTKPFPEWKLCLNTDNHPNENYILFRGNVCPVCARSLETQQIHRIRWEPIRFVVACPEGHMDDVDWYTVVHGPRSNCPNNRYFIWRGSGMLSSITLECPFCGASRNLGSAYGDDYECTGRYPERENVNERPYRPGNCRSRAKMIQRQASNLRIPEIRTLFTIPPRYTELHRLLQLRPIFSLIVAVRIRSKDELAEMLQRLVDQGVISETVMEEILSHSWDDIRQAINDILTPPPTSYEDLLLEEFHELIKGSVNGIPPLIGPSVNSPPLIEIDPNLVKKFEGPNGHVFRVVPILHLRAVTVQIGYRREIPIRNTTPKLVDIGFPDSRDPLVKWYPGVELFGEGIFIMLDENEGWHFELSGSDSHEWLRAFSNSSNDVYPSYVFRGRFREELHPVFVWWHTLSHLLIRSVSLEAGYSSASIRERVYIELRDGRARGGVVLYATQPGADGTLGGLVALVPYFDSILERALESARICSGDPLCSETHFKKGMYNGAACYGCLLLSETSCEHRNMWLDRNVLNENPP